MDKPAKLILTCEHATNRIPNEYRFLFQGREALLESHKGYDPGALALAKKIASVTKSPLYCAPASRLLIEMNRSLGHLNIFSEVTKPLPDEEKDRIVSRYYLPHRNEVEQEISRRVHEKNRVLHVGVHTCAAELNGEVRWMDIGLLYDPARPLEKELCALWKEELCRIRPNLRVRFNYPYLGKADGFTTALRKKFLPGDYLGIEIEVNQKYVDTPEWKVLIRQVADSLLPFSR